MRFSSGPVGARLELVGTRGASSLSAASNFTSDEQILFQIFIGGAGTRVDGPTAQGIEGNLHRFINPNGVDIECLDR